MLCQAGNLHQSILETKWVMFTLNKMLPAYEDRNSQSRWSQYNKNGHCITLVHHINDDKEKKRGGEDTRGHMKCVHFRAIAINSKTQRPAIAERTLCLCSVVFIF